MIALADITGAAVVHDRIAGQWQVQVQMRDGQPVLLSGLSWAARLARRARMAGHDELWVLLSSAVDRALLANAERRPPGPPIDPRGEAE